MDTDSSLPPLLFLAASLLLFVWVNIVAVVGRQPTDIVRLLGPPRSPAVAFWRVMFAAASGISALGFLSTLTAGWPISLVLLAAIVLTAGGLLALQWISQRWALRFPQAARRLAGPATRWLGVGVRPVNGEAHSHENGDSQTATRDAGLADQNRAPEPAPLTPAEILNLDHHDIHMVRSISHMDDLDVKDIMVPSLDVDAVAVSLSLIEVVQKFVATKHSRMPVYSGTMDDVVGVVHISDVLLQLADGQTDAPINSIMRDPEFVAENMAVDDLLHLMRSKFLQMVIVVDEYGGVEGIVTLEDVLEEIVGDIDDEFAESGQAELTANEDGTWLVNAAMPVAELASAVGVELDCGDVNTIGGYVYTQLGRMPSAGDVIPSAGLSIEVTQVRGRRIHQLRLIPARSGSEKS